MIVETMGRYNMAGSRWNKLAAAPTSSSSREPYDIDAIVEVQTRDTAQHHHHHHRRGTRAKGGGLVVAQKVAGSHDPVRLGGVAHVLRERLQSRLKRAGARHGAGPIQRGGSPAVRPRAGRSSVTMPLNC